MALAFDATSGANAAANILTFSQTCTGSDLILWAGVTVNGGTGDNVSVTYNTVPMTKGVVKNIGGQFAYLWYLIAPSTGTHSVIVTDTEVPAALRAQVGSYTGAAQTGQPDATGNASNGAASSITAPVTVVANNCWIVSCVGNDGALAETPAGVLTTSRGNQNQVCYLGDSNGLVSTGSQNATWTSGSQSLVAVAASFKDNTSSATGGPFLINFL